MAGAGFLRLAASLQDLYLAPWLEFQDAGAVPSICLRICSYFPLLVFRFQVSGGVPLKQIYMVYIYIYMCTCTCKSVVKHKQLCVYFASSLFAFSRTVSHLFTHSFSHSVHPCILSGKESHNKGVNRATRAMESARARRGTKRGFWLSGTHPQNSFWRAGTL